MKQPTALATLILSTIFAMNISQARDTGRSLSPAKEPIVIGHRGASGYVPEHTLTAYLIAIQQGADYVEPDLVSTKDGVLVARHENEIGSTTDVAAHAEFADRKRTKVIDGNAATGWFTEDFTLVELKTLRARERLPNLRVANTRFNDQFEIPTFEEVLSLVHSINEQRTQAVNRSGNERPKPIGVYPETKHPSYFDSIGLALEEPLLRSLAKWGYAGRNAPVFIQSFEVGNLRQLRKKTQLPLIQLIEAEGAPYDLAKRPDHRSYADLVTLDGLADVAAYADGIGVDKALIIPRAGDGSLGSPTSLVADAHAKGLLVHAWTFRAENEFLPREYRLGSSPGEFGNLPGEIQKFLALGLDGIFTDHPIVAVDARRKFLNR